MSQHFGPCVPTSARLLIPRTLAQELKALSPEVRQWLASVIEDVWESRRRETADELFPHLLDPHVGARLDAIRAMLTGRLSLAGRDEHTDGCHPPEADRQAAGRAHARPNIGLSRPNRWSNAPNNGPSRPNSARLPNAPACSPRISAGAGVRRNPDFGATIPRDPVRTTRRSPPRADCARRDKP